MSQVITLTGKDGLSIRVNAEKILLYQAVTGGTVVELETGAGSRIIEVTQTPAQLDAMVNVPVISSLAVADVDENVAGGTTVYTATSSSSNIASFLIGGTDAADFSIDAATGVVSITDSPDYETKDTYVFDVIALDTAGRVGSKRVTLSINDLVET